MLLFLRLSFFTIWITPIVFILSLIEIIKAIKAGENHQGYTIACVVSFWLIVVPLFLMALLSY